MELTEKIKTLFEVYTPYLRKFSYGIAFPFIANTSWRKGNEPDKDLLYFYKNRDRFSDDENFIDYFMVSTRRDLAYAIGMLVGGVGVVPGLIEYGLNQIKSGGNATVLLTTLGAIAAGNLASILYEKTITSKNIDNIAS